jgi:tetratricopeptide (TPR) repeat protein
MDQLTGELAAWAESLAFRRRLAKIDPSNAQWRHDEACILNRIGNICRDAGKNTDAMIALAGEVAIWREMAQAAPRDRQRQLNIATSLKRFADAKVGAADVQGAIAAYEESLVSWRRLLRGDPDNTRWLSNLAQCLEKIGDLKRLVADDQGACIAYEELLLIDRQLVELDINDSELLWNLSLSLDRIGNVKLILHDLDAAATAYEESLTVRRRLVETDPSNLGWQEGIVSALEKISDLKRVAETAAPAPAPDRTRFSVFRLLRERHDAEWQKKFFLYADKMRTAKDFAIDGTIAVYETGLGIGRNLLEKRSELRLTPALFALKLSFAEVGTITRTRLRRYARKGGILLSKRFPRLRAGVRTLECSTESLETPLGSFHDHRTTATSISTHTEDAGVVNTVNHAGPNIPTKRNRKRRRRRRGKRAAGSVPAHQHFAESAL